VNVGPSTVPSGVVTCTGPVVDPGAITAVVRFVHGLGPWQEVLDADRAAVEIAFFGRTMPEMRWEVPRSLRCRSGAEHGETADDDKVGEQS
jgi:hypothetical protein